MTSVAHARGRPHMFRKLAAAHGPRSHCAIPRFVAARRCAALMLVITCAAFDSVVAQTPSSWTNHGRPTSQALAVLAFMLDVPSRGLQPSDYAADRLATEARMLGAAIHPDSAAATRFDAQLTGSLVMLLRHLHAGRTPPRALGFRIPDTHQTLDFKIMAQAMSTAPDVLAAFALAEPRYAGYRALLSGLARYRKVAADSALRAPASLSRTVRSGEPYVDAPALRRWLGALGDLTVEHMTVPDSLVRRYDPALSAAVKRFQGRHGLDTTGVLGRSTAAALRVSAARRVQQVELALERWRWLPDVPPARYAVVNIPAFRLYVFENDNAAVRPVIRMDVIVGRAYIGRRTPIFTATMSQVVLRPYWDRPVSIARDELIPLIRRNRQYLQRESLEIVSGGDEGAQIFPATDVNLSRVARGSLRLRQRPGEANALGPAKFLFPNAHNVYLHGTPSRQLFSQSRRDFSHGCIRVQDPAALAELVLRGQPRWDRTSIDAAMAGSRPTRIEIARPLGVFILYSTVVADDDVLRFYPDIYGHDAALERVLKAQRSGGA